MTWARLRVYLPSNNQVEMADPNSATIHLFMVDCYPGDFIFPSRLPRFYTHKWPSQRHENNPRLESNQNRCLFQSLCSQNPQFCSVGGPSLIVAHDWHFAWLRETPWPNLPCILRETCHHGGTCIIRVATLPFWRLVSSPTWWLMFSNYKCFELPKMNECSVKRDHRQREISLPTSSNHHFWECILVFQEVYTFVCLEKYVTLYVVFMTPNSSTCCWNHLNPIQFHPIRIISSPLKQIHSPSMSVRKNPIPKGGFAWPGCSEKVPNTFSPNGGHLMGESMW